MKDGNEMSKCCGWIVFETSSVATVAARVVVNKKPWTRALTLQSGARCSDADVTYHF